MSLRKKTALLSGLLAVLPAVVAPVLADMPPANNKDYLKQKTVAPKTPLDHNNRGVVLGMRGQWTQAFKEHELAIAGDPNNKTFKTNYSAALLRHGDELFKQGEYKQAVDTLKKSLEIDSNNKAAARILAQAEAGLKQKPRLRAKPTKQAN